MSSRSNASTDGGTPANRSSASVADLEARDSASDAGGDARSEGGRSSSSSGKASTGALKSGKVNRKPESTLAKDAITDAKDAIIDAKDGKGHGSAQADQQLFDLQKESMRIEDSIMVAQRVVQFQRAEAEISIAEAEEAKRLVERELHERVNLESANTLASKDRAKRKEIKSFLIDVVNVLKDKQMEAKHLKEAQAVATALRLSLQKKRQAYQQLARQVEDRERIERTQLQEAHERSAKNLVVWQELELRQLNDEEREGSRRINKIRAQQQKEIQQKEGEQLRELQHLKAKFSMGQFDMEMEFTESFERQKADQLVEVQKLDRKHKREKQESKKKILSMREQLRATNDDEMNQGTAEQLLQNQEMRARELIDQQKHKATEREKAFELEMQVRAEEFKESIQQDKFELGTHSNSNGSGSQSLKSNSSVGQKSDAATGLDETEEKETLEKAGDDLQPNVPVLENSDNAKRRKDRHISQMRVYLNQAEVTLQQQKEQQQRDRAAAAEEHARLNANTLSEFENRKSLFRQANEQRTMELIKTHSKEKGDIQAAHERELESVRRSIELEKELHSKSLSETQVASQAKSEFLSFVCHELRNPLSGIVAIVDMLLGSKLSDDLKNHIDTIKHESELMCAIVNDVLDFAKIEANMLVLDPVMMKLHKTVEEMVKEQQLIALKMKPDLEVRCVIARDVPKQIVTDPIRLRQVLLNLISNAIKFTFQGSVTVIVSAEAQKGSLYTIKFEVVDTGVGISDSDQEHIFSAFSQANPSTTREFGGTGLGLSISKALVERLGGSISVESKKGEGTRFFFTISGEVKESGGDDTPRSSAREIKAKPVEMPAGLKVLVVEDSSTLRRLWAKLLKEQKCDVETATNGMDAIERCSAVLKEGKESYDVVLMDITMPIMSGDDAVRKLREMGWKGIVIALTANAMESDRQHYLEAGMDAVITKPFQMNQLRSVISDLLEKKKIK